MYERLKYNNFTAITCDSSRTSTGNGSVTCSDTNQIGSACTYTCNKGFALSNISLAHTVCTDDGDDDSEGQWNPIPTDCKGKLFFVYVSDI